VNSRTARSVLIPSKSVISLKAETAPAGLTADQYATAAPRALSTTRVWCTAGE
jgi:hypothetical protein